MPTIRFHDSDGIDKDFEVGAEPVMIGRALDCQLRTDDAKVSRRHARIFWEDGYFIEDLGSSNGVYVGMERVKRAPLPVGQVVVCGSLVLQLLPEAEPSVVQDADGLLEPFDEPGTDPGAQAAAEAPPLAPELPLAPDEPIHAEGTVADLGAVDATASDDLAEVEVAPPPAAVAGEAAPRRTAPGFAKIAPPPPPMPLPPVAPPPFVEPPLPRVTPVGFAAAAPPPPPVAPLPQPALVEPYAAEGPAGRVIPAQIHDNAIITLAEERARLEEAQQVAAEAEARARAAEEARATIEAELNRLRTQQAAEGERQAAERSALEERLADLEAGARRLHTVEDAHNRTTEELESLRRERDRLHQRVEDLQSEVDARSAQSATQDLERLRVQLTRTIEERQAIVRAGEEIKARLAEAEKEGEGLRRRVVVLTGENGRLREEAEDGRHDVMKRLQATESELQAVRNQAAERDAEIVRLRAVATPPKSPAVDLEKAALDKKIRQLSGEIERLREEEAQHATVAAGKAKADQQISRLTAEIAELKSELAKGGGQATELAALAGAKGQLEGEVSRLAAALERAREEIAAGEEAREQVQRLAEDMAELRRAAAEEGTAGQAQLAAAEEAREAAERQVAELTARLADTDGQAGAGAALAAKLAELEKTKATLMDQVADLRGELSRARDQGDRASAGQQSELAASVAARAQLAQELSTLQQELSTLRAASAERDALRQQLTTAIQERTASVEEQSALAGELAVLREQVAAAVAGRSAAEATLAGLAGQGDAARQSAAEMESLKAQLAAAVAAKVESERATSELRDRLATLRSQAAGDDALQAKLAATEAARATLETEVGKLRTDLGSLNGQIARTAENNKAKLAALSKELGESQGQLAQVQAQIERLTADAALGAEARRTIEDLTAERDRLHLRASHLERDLEAALADPEREQLRARVERLNEQLAEAQKGQGPGLPAGLKDAVAALEDAFSELRSSLRAANDEAAMLTAPADSVQIVADALSQATGQLEVARSSLREVGRAMGS